MRLTADQLEGTRRRIRQALELMEADQRAATIDDLRKRFCAACGGLANEAERADGCQCGALRQDQWAMRYRAEIDEALLQTNRALEDRGEARLALDIDGTSRSAGFTWEPTGRVVPIVALDPVAWRSAALLFLRAVRSAAQALG